MKDHIPTCIIIFFIVATIGFAVWPVQWNDVRRKQAPQSSMLSQITGFICAYETTYDKLPDTLSDLRKIDGFHDFEKRLIRKGLIHDISEIKYNKTLDADQITLLYTKEGEWAGYGDGHVK